MGWIDFSLTNWRICNRFVSRALMLGPIFISSMSRGNFFSSNKAKGISIENSPPFIQSVFFGGFEAVVSYSKRTSCSIA